MAIPTTDNNADVAAERIRQIAKSVRQEAVKYIAQCDANAVNAHDLVSALGIQQLTPGIVLWATLKAVTGVPAAMRLKFPGVWASEAAVTTDLNAAQTVMEETLAYIVTNTPKDGSGWVLTLRVTANLFEQRVVTAGAQITPLRAQLVLLRDAFS
jgi:hypothetical protein